MSAGHTLYASCQDLCDSQDHDILEQTKQMKQMLEQREHVKKTKRILDEMKLCELFGMVCVEPFETEQLVGNTQSGGAVSEQRSNTITNTPWMHCEIEIRLRNVTAAALRA